MKIAIFVAAGFFAACPAGAQAETAALKRCLANIDMNAMTNTQRVACATKEMDRADGALNTEYRMKMAALPASRRIALRTEERRWIDHRHRECRQGRFERELNPPGKSYAVPGAEYFRMRCLIDETDARTAKVRAFR